MFLFQFSQIIEHLSTDIIETLERLSNDALTWINKVLDIINKTGKDKVKKKEVKKLHQAEIFLNYVKSRLHTKVFATGNKGRKQSKEVPAITGTDASRGNRRNTANISEVYFAYFLCNLEIHLMTSRLGVI